MVLARRLIPPFGGAGSFTGTRTRPSSFGLTRYSGNPVITVNPGNPAETTEQYVPAAVKVGTTTWVYVKGGSRIYAWSSTDGTTYTLANGGAAVLAPVAATWEGSFVLEPVVVYDQSNDLIHLWYKGRDANPNNWAWGHATAPGSTPTVFTRDGANPILTAATVATALGGGTITDLAIGDVVLIGSTYHFYGYCLDTTYHIIQATGSTWNNPSGISTIYSASGGDTVVETPAVFALPGIGPALYAMFYARGVAQPGVRSIRCATSSDGATWDFSNVTDILAPTGSGWEKDETFSGHMLKVNTSPWCEPLMDGAGRWVYYYSGLNVTVADAGIAYFVPVP